MVGETKIFVVMPAYNEAAHIGGVLHRVPAIVDNIIVVDDYSSDGTAEVAGTAGDGRIEVIRNSQNLGVGGAVVAGYRRALAEHADIVVKIDADGQMDPQEINKLVFPITEGKADYAKGFRFHNRKVLKSMPRLRLVGNLGLSYLVKMASGYWDIFDPTCGFTAIHKTALSMLELDKLSRDYFFETGMLCSLYRIQAVIKDVYVSAYYGDEVSKLNPLKVLVQFPGRLLRAYLKRICWRYFVRDFSTFSILFVSGWGLFAFGVVFGVVKWYVNASKGVVTPTGTVMLSVVPLFLGFQMILQAVLLDIGNVPKEPLQKQYDNAVQPQ